MGARERDIYEQWSQGQSYDVNPDGSPIYTGTELDKMDNAMNGTSVNGVVTNGATTDKKDGVADTAKGAEGGTEIDPNVLTPEQLEQLEILRSQYEAYKQPFNEPRPDRADSYYNQNIKFINDIFPGISKEEEDRRARKAEWEGRIGSWGNALAALANAYTVGQHGAVSQTIQPYQAPDIYAWRKAMQDERNQALAYKRQLLQADENLYLTDRKQWEANKRASENYNARIDAQALAADKQLRSQYLRANATAAENEKNRETKKEIATQNNQTKVAVKGMSGGRGGGSGSGGKYHDTAGNTYQSQNDYNAAVAKQALDAGIISRIPRTITAKDAQSWDAKLAARRGNRGGSSSGNGGKFGGTKA